MKRTGSPLDEAEHTDDPHKRRDMVAYAIVAAVLLGAAYLYFTKAI